jgi:putative flippase GtrA
MVREFGRFCVVGGAGFLLDAALLQALISLMGLGPYSARLLSFLGAVTLTWVLNRSYTFHSPARNAFVKGEWLHYTGLMVFGAIVNYAAYAYCLINFPLVAQFPVLGVAAGSFAGLLLNFSTSRYLFSRALAIRSLEEQ